MSLRRESKTSTVPSPSTLLSSFARSAARLRRCTAVEALSRLESAKDTLAANSSAIEAALFDGKLFTSIFLEPNKDNFLIMRRQPRLPLREASRAVTFTLL